MRTVQTIKDLRAADLSQAQAEAIAQAIESSGLEELTKDVSSLKTEVAVLKWMVGFNIVMTVAILWKVFAS
jgi:hypothetical protein